MQGWGRGIAVLQILGGWLGGRNRERISLPLPLWNLSVIPLFCNCFSPSPHLVGEKTRSIQYSMECSVFIPSKGRRTLNTISIFILILFYLPIVLTVLYSTILYSLISSYLQLISFLSLLYYYDLSYSSYINYHHIIELHLIIVCFIYLLNDIKLYITILTIIPLHWNFKYPPFLYRKINNMKIYFVSIFFSVIYEIFRRMSHGKPGKMHRKRNIHL